MFVGYWKKLIEKKICKVSYIICLNIVDSYCFINKSGYLLIKTNGFVCVYVYFNSKIQRGLHYTTMKKVCVDDQSLNAKNSRPEEERIQRPENNKNQKKPNSSICQNIFHRFLDNAMFFTPLKP